MRRRVKILTPLEEYARVQAHLLDPWSPEIRVTGQSDRACPSNQTGKACNDRSSWDVTPEALRQDQNAKSARFMEARFSSMPEITSNTFRTQAQNIDTDSKSTQQTTFPAVPNILNTAWPKSQEDMHQKSQKDDGSTQSECSANSMIDFQQEGSRGHIVPGIGTRNSLQTKRSLPAGNNEDCDLHEAARRSIEASRMKEKQVQKSNPVTIPEKKNSRRFFGF